MLKVTLRSKSIQLFLFRLIEYFSSLRRTKYAAFIFFSLMFSSFVIGIGLGGLTWESLLSIKASSPTNNIVIIKAVNCLKEYLYVVLSGIFLSILIISIRTAFTATRTDIDYIFTSGISFRQYALAEALYQLIILNIFFTPFYTYILILHLLSPELFNIIHSIIATELFLFTGIIYGQVLFLAYRKYKKICILSCILIIILFLYPIIHLVFSTPIPPSKILLPSILLVDIATSTPPHLYFYAYLLTSYMLVGLIIWYLITEKDFFGELEPITIGVFAGLSERRLVPILSRKYKFLVKYVKLDSSHSLFRLHFSKELARIVRDGSLFVTLLLSIIYALLIYYILLKIFGVSIIREGLTDPIKYITAILISYTFVIFSPSVIIERWRLSERRSLWILLSSATDLNSYLNAVTTLTILISLILPFTLIAVFSIFSPTYVLLILSMSLITLGIISPEIAYGLEFKYGKETYNTFSADYWLIVFSSAFISALLILPNIISLYFIENMDPIIVCSATILYDIILIYLAYLWMKKQFKYIRIS